jgi:hypothetical protein
MSETAASPQDLLSELLARKRAQAGLVDYIAYCEVGFVPAAHHRLLITHLEEVERGECKRLMVPGQVCRVTWKSPVWHDRPVYRVITDCGDSIIADEEHEWPVRLCSKRPDIVKLKQTKDLVRRRSKRPMIRRALALELPERELPLDPYVLGYWLILDKLLVMGAETREFGDRRECSALIFEQRHPAAGNAGMLIINFVALRAGFALARRR